MLSSTHGWAIDQPKVSVPVPLHHLRFTGEGIPDACDVFEGSADTRVWRRCANLSHSVARTLQSSGVSMSLPKMIRSGRAMPTWGSYEAGLEPIPVDQAVKLAAYGIPLEWIYQGRMTNLHPHVRAKIRKLQT
jgi:hypothetical protein